MICPYGSIDVLPRELAALDEELELRQVRAGEVVRQIGGREPKRAVIRESHHPSISAKSAHAPQSTSSGINTHLRDQPLCCRRCVSVAISIPKPPKPSSSAAQSVMRGNRKRDTRPEKAVRAALHQLGLRYRVDLKLGIARSSPRPDIVFTRARVALFVDGCFWHGCPVHGVQPRTNSAYWAAKVARNQERDRENDELLQQQGWFVIRAWEHEEPTDVAQRVACEVRSRIVAASTARERHSW